MELLTSGEIVSRLRPAWTATLSAGQRRTRTARAFRSRLLGSAADTPVNQPSNSTADRLETSSILGNSTGLHSGIAKPESHVVADITPASFSQGRKSEL